MKKYLVFIFLLCTITIISGHSSIRERQEKRSYGLVHDVVQQMVAEQIERKKILKAFGEMKNELSDIKRELKERNTLLKDTKFLQRKLIRMGKEIKKEIKTEAMDEVKKAMKGYSKRIKLVQNRQQKTETVINITKKDIDVMKKSSAKQFNFLQQNVEDLQNKTSSFWQVAFTAKLRDHQRTASAIHFNDVITNIGGGYNSRDGIFNCPRPGLYMFTTSLMGSLNFWVDAYIMKNNESTARLYEQFGSNNKDYPSSSTTVMLRLSIGDKVWVKGNGYKYHGGETCTFSGILIKN